MLIKPVLLACAISAWALLSAALPAARAASRQPVPLPSWDGAQGPGGWTFSDPQRVKVVADGTAVSYLSVVNGAATSVEQVGASIALPLAIVAGSRIGVSVDVRATDVSKPVHSYNGIKAMVHVTAPNRSDTWDQAAGNGDSFPFSYDWKTLTFQTVVPRDASSALLILGLQDSAGQADFRNLQVRILRTLPVPPKSPPTGPVFTGHGPGSLRGTMISPNIQAEDIETLAKWHVNLVRWQILWNGFPHSRADQADTAEYDKWLDSNLAHLDDMLPHFKKAGIAVVVDLHTPPGGRGSDKVMRIFTDAQWQKHFGVVWDKIARKYRGDQRIWGYDLVNEPVLPGGETGLLDWHDLAEQTAKHVRQIDPVHAIIIEPDPWGSVPGLAYFAPLDVPGIVYSVHMYDPGQFTHQGVLDGLATGPVYPGVIGGTQWDKDRIRKALKPAIDYAKTYNVHIYIGEFSAVRWAKGADKYISDVIDVMEENGWDWSYHAFREWQGWSPEVGEDKDVTTPSPAPTARLLVLQAAFAHNQAATTKVFGPK
ncbi:MAG: cellulase family glycosylhydrolase [Capsulimonadaceae bacterium]|nr:cellulase family glycosylhydrolase [Capsulimonadaceae bacterium]